MLVARVSALESIDAQLRSLRQAMLDCEVTPTALTDMYRMLGQRDVLLERRSVLVARESNSGSSSR